MMNVQEVKTIIMQELPRIIVTDEEVRRFVLKIGREQFADRIESSQRFDRIMDELVEQRKRSDRRWEEWREEWAEYRRKSDEKWEAWEKKWEETQRESDEKWKEIQRKSDEKWEAWEKKWEETQQAWEKKWEETQRESDEKWKKTQRKSDEKWEQNLREHEEFKAEMKRLSNKMESSYGALGARWGIHSEASFRNALKGILEDSFDVKVINVNEFDDEGEVFGRPDQIELDIIIKNGLLIICEIKSSVGKGQMYVFERKVRFYEKRHARKVSRMIVISPMINEGAKIVAKDLGIEMYSHVDAVGTI